MRRTEETQTRKHADECCCTASLRRRLDCHEEPVPPLRPKDSAFAAEVVARSA